jgi:hypothetical protein
MNNDLANHREVYQLLVSLLMIGPELSRKDHSPIPFNCDREGLEQFDARTDLQIRLGGTLSRILMVEKNIGGVKLHSNNMG